MRVKKKSPSPRSGRAITAIRPTQTSQTARPAAVATAVTGLNRPPVLAPPLERSLTQFAQELRKELTKAQDQIQALQSELTALQTRYEGHTHAYTRMSTGSGGNQWFSLGHLKHYIDEEKESHDKWGVYFREGGSTGNAPEVMTGPPSS
jgi:hypothetical protein